MAIHHLSITLPRVRVLLPGAHRDGFGRLGPVRGALCTYVA